MPRSSSHQLRPPPQPSVTTPVGAVVQPVRHFFQPPLASNPINTGGKVVEEVVSTTYQPVQMRIAQQNLMRKAPGTSTGCSLLQLFRPPSRHTAGGIVPSVASSRAQSRDSSVEQRTSVVSTPTPCEQRRHLPATKIQVPPRTFVVARPSLGAPAGAPPPARFGPGGVQQRSFPHQQQRASAVQQPGSDLGGSTSHSEATIPPPEGAVASSLQQQSSVVPTPSASTTYRRIPNAGSFLSPAMQMRAAAPIVALQRTPAPAPPQQQQCRTQPWIAVLPPGGDTSNGRGNGSRRVVSSSAPQDDHAAMTDHRAVQELITRLQAESDMREAQIRDLQRHLDACSPTRR